MDQMAEALFKAGLIDKKQRQASERQQAALRAQESKHASRGRNLLKEEQQAAEGGQELEKEPVSITGALAGGSPSQAQA